jgi:hypothetical protein
MRRLSIALFAPLSLLACDTSEPAADLARTDATSSADTADAGNDPQSADPDSLPFLVSRFGPNLGLSGTHVTLLTAFEPSGCAAAGTCEVTVGGVETQIVNDVGLLEVVVPLGVRTGPVCVTWLGRLECGETFTVLTASLLHAIEPAAVAVGEDTLTLSLHGEAFLPDAVVAIDWQRLETTYLSPNHLTAVVPASIFESAGAKAVMVYAPTSSRCGTYSEPLSLVVE